MRQALTADCMPCLVSEPLCVAGQLNHPQDVAFPIGSGNPKLKTSILEPAVKTRQAAA